MVKRRKGLFNRVKNLFGSGLQDSAVKGTLKAKDDLISRRNDVEDQDQEFRRRRFDGDPNAEKDKLARDLDQEKNAIKKQAEDQKISPEDADRQIVRAQGDHDESLRELERKKAFQKDELDMEQRITAIRRDGRNVASGEAEARMNRAKADMDAGSKEGPEHDQRKAAYERAQFEHDEATRRDSGCPQRYRGRGRHHRGEAEGAARGNRHCPSAPGGSPESAGPRSGER